MCGKEFGFAKGPPASDPGSFQVNSECDLPEFDYDPESFELFDQLKDLWNIEQFKKNRQGIFNLVNFWLLPLGSNNSKFYYKKTCKSFKEIDLQDNYFLILK